MSKFLVNVELKYCKRIEQLEFKNYSKNFSKEVGKGCFFRTPADYLNSINRKCYEVDFNSKAPIRSVKLGKVEILQI